MAQRSERAIGKRWLNRNIFGMGLASLFSDMNHEMASAVLPIFLSSVLGAPAFALGLIEGVADGVSTFFEVWSGWYSDRIGRRKGLAAFGYFVTAFSKASFALATSWPHVLVGRTVGWIGWSIRSPVRDALLTESTTEATIGRAFAFHRTLDTMGAIAGPMIAVVLLATTPIRWIFVVSLVPGIFAFLSILICVREKEKKRETRNTWDSVKALPDSYFRFLVPLGLFGISNFAPTLLIFRAQEQKGYPERGISSVWRAVLWILECPQGLYSPCWVIRDQWNLHSNRRVLPACAGIHADSKGPERSGIWTP
jgi:MFS family permease